MDDLERSALEDALAVPIGRIYRDRASPFETLSDSEFYNRFRFTRYGFHEVVNMIEGLDRPTFRSRSLSTAQRLAITLHVLAGNPFQQTVGDLFGVSQSTVSRTVEEITDYFSANVHDFVKWHSDTSARSMAERVFEKFRLPSVVGSIDGSHVRIQAPKHNEYVYVNRKGYHSLNVAVVVDDSYRVLWFSAGWPGSTHDSKAFRESGLHSKFENGEIFGRLVGDSAYRAEKYMIKVFSGNNLTQKQQNYNKALCGFRVVVEQAFGQIKRVFHILHSELRYDPVRASKIVAAAICLRNMQINLREPLVDVDDAVADDNADNAPQHTSDASTQSGLATMNAIASTYF